MNVSDPLRKSIVAAVIVVAAIFASDIAVAGDGALRVTYTAQYSENDLIFDRIGDYDIIRLKGENCLAEPGKPMLPMSIIKLALPEGMTATKIEILDVNSITLHGRYDIFPAQPPLEIGSAAESTVFTMPDKSVYESSLPFPSKMAELLGQSDLAGQAMAAVGIYPVRYIPQEKQLELVTSVTFAVEGDPGYICGDYLPYDASAKQRELYESRLKAIVVNDQDVDPVCGTRLLKDPGNLPPGGPFDHVIITSVSNAPFYQPLVDWHIQRGLRDTVITVDYIYANYTGSDNQEKIRNFVIDAHQNWATLYFLIGGENTTVPFEYRNYENTNIPSDVYYADYDDDWEYEVFVGRITAEGQQQIQKFIHKILKYETDPPLLNYPLNITLLGMDLTIPSEPPYYTLTRGQELKDTIDIEDIPALFHVTKVYDTQSGNHRDAFLAALNTGQNLVNHNDHSNYYVMCTGDRNHNWYISYLDVPYLTNTDKFSIIFSLGCDANRMDFEDAISEHFILDVDSTGALAFTGNTRSGWFYVGIPISLSAELDLYWWKAIFEQDIVRLGEMLAYAKSATEIEYTWPYSEWTLNLLGEPEMPIWTAIPSTFYVTHDSQLNAVPSTFSVHVAVYGGIPVQDAYVCLWKGNEIYQRGFTGPDGNAALEISPTTRGTMYVTVTKQNHIPYQGQAEVVGNVPPVCEVPGDTLIFQCLAGEVNLPVGCFDGDGNLETGPIIIDGPGQIVDGHWRYTPTGDDSVAVTIRCIDSMDYVGEQTFIVLFDINAPPVCHVPGDTSIVQVFPIEELQLPAYGVDNNIVEQTVTEGPGSLGTDGYWHYMPSGDEDINVTVKFTDICGESDEGVFHVDYQVFVCGDASGDDEVNILDVTSLINYVYKSGNPPKPLISGDMNANGIINILDITYLINFLYMQGSAPVCPS
jgi:hypothetical protein